MRTRANRSEPKSYARSRCGHRDQRQSRHRLGVSGEFCFHENDYRVYFALETEERPQSAGTFDEMQVNEGSNDAKGPRVGGYLAFAPGLETVHVKVGISYVSAANAAMNLEKEIPGWEIEKVRSEHRRPGALYGSRGGGGRERNATARLLYRDVSFAAASDGLQRREWGLPWIRQEGSQDRGGTQPVCEFFGLGHLPEPGATDCTLLPDVASELRNRW